MKQITLKRGATLQFEATVANAGGPVDLSAWTITSQVRDRSGALVGSVGVVKADQATAPGSYTLRAQTAGWPVGLHLWDIAYAYSDGAGGETVAYTETVQLQLAAAITQTAP